LAVLAACLTAAPVARAQQPPWTVTLTPTLNPLPIGLCGAIALRVFDEGTRDVPRNPLGFRVTMADFDIVVSAPDGRSAAAQQIDSTHVNACACQGGAVGATATVTATYPARLLAANARIPGVSFQTSAPFTIAAAKGAVNPASCVAAGAIGVGGGAGLATASAAATAAAPAPVRGDPSLLARPIAPAPAGRPVAYSPVDITVSPSLSATGVWSEPGAVTVYLSLNATGTWTEPGAVTVYVDLSAIGTWVGAPASNFTIP